MSTPTSPEGPPAPGPVALTDPRAIRALAHPARVAVIERLYDGAVLTATECAEVAGLTPSAMSYHLRALEKWGLVTRAEATEDGRERPWRAAGTSVQVESSGSVAGRAAEHVLVDTMIERLRRHADTAMRLAASRPEGTGGPGGVSTARLLLTKEEADHVSGVLRELLERYEARSRDGGPEGAMPYQLWWALLPQGDEPPVGVAAGPPSGSERPSGRTPERR